MLASSFFPRVRVTRRMIHDAVAYAMQSLHYTYDRMGLQPYDRLKHIFEGMLIQEAFRKWLDDNGIAYDRRGETHFTQTDKYDIGIGGKRFDVKGFVISAAGHVWAIRQNPEWLLDCAALVPVDQFDARASDAYVFAFLLAPPNPNVREHYWVQIFGERWKPNTARGPLGTIELNWHGRSLLPLELGGQTHAGELLVEQLTLEPNRPTRTRLSFDGLLYLCTEKLPAADIYIRAENANAHNATNAKARGWRDFALEEGEVFFVGWMAKEEFARRAKILPKGNSCKQYRATKTDNYARLVSELRAMKDISGRGEAFAKL